MQNKQSKSQEEAGSLLLYILIGIVLIGALTIALRNSGSGTGNIDKEDLILKAGQVQRYGSELAASVTETLSNSVISETTIRFAHPDAPVEYGDITGNPPSEVFSKEGGKANYRQPPLNVNDGSPWEFYATTSIPQVGSDRTELIAVLPNVTEAFCEVINNQLGFTKGTQPTDSATGSTPDCIQGSASDRFTGSYNDASPNTLDDTTFSRLPALQACVYCASGSTYNYYYVLMAR
jgi:hypothetical protein